MFVRFFWFFAFLLLAVPLIDATARAQEIGVVASASGAGEIRTAGGRARLGQGVRLSVGDVVSTDANGRAQLVFDDGTKIVVGGGSRLEIETILMQSNGKAQRFAVSAVGGTFRFITGNSAKSAYSITTPTATMGIRGTTFDFSVKGQERTNLVLFKGRVLMCGQNGNCAEVRGRCTLITLRGSGQFSGKESVEQKDDVLAAEFPFVMEQEPLKREFRAPVGSCGDVSARIAARAPKSPAAVAAETALPSRTGGADNFERDRPSEPTRAEPERPSPPEAPSAPEPEPPPGND